MKIALIGRYGEGDIIPGPERVSRELYISLKGKNCDVTFIEYFFNGYSDYSFLNKIFGSKIKKDNGVLRLGIIPLILKLLKEQFDIIHIVNSQRFILIIFLFKNILKGKIISTVHGFYQYELPEKKRKRQFLDLLVEKKIIHNSDLLIFPSNLLLTLFKNHYEIPKDKNRIIFNGIGSGFFFNKKYFNRNNKLNCIYYNTFGKGLNKFLLSMPEEIKSQIKISVLGRKNKYDTQNKDIEIVFSDAMNQKSLIKFLEDKHFIVKSEFESFSILTAECMAAGVIPIVSEDTGIKEIISNGVNGFIYKDNKSLPVLLKEIFGDRYNLPKISENASKIYDELKWDKISSQYITVYKLLL